jgi:hypothetical protein
MPAAFCPSCFRNRHCRKRAVSNRAAAPVPKPSSARRAASSTGRCDVGGSAWKPSSAAARIPRSSPCGPGPQDCPARRRPSSARMAHAGAWQFLPSTVVGASPRLRRKLRSALTSLVTRGRAAAPHVVLAPGTAHSSWGSVSAGLFEKLAARQASARHIPCSEASYLRPVQMPKARTLTVDGERSTAPRGGASANAGVLGAIVGEVVMLRWRREIDAYWLARGCEVCQPRARAPGHRGKGLGERPATQPSRSRWQYERDCSSQGAARGGPASSTADQRSAALCR